jgi:hypothetical protein
VIQPSGRGLRSGLLAGGEADMLQSMRSRENDGAPGVTDKCELYMMLDHHWTSGPEARDHAACSSCAASPHGGTYRPRPPEVSAEVRVDHRQRQSIYQSSSVQFNPVQSSLPSIAVARMAERSSCGPCDPPVADSGQTTMCPTPAKTTILNWAQHQFERYTVYDSQGPIKISI